MLAADDLLHRIITELESHGLDSHTYTLYEHVDIDALEDVIQHDTTEQAVSFPVNDYWVTVMGNGEIDVQPP